MLPGSVCRVIPSTSRFRHCFFQCGVASGKKFRSMSPSFAAQFVCSHRRRDADDIDANSVRARLSFDAATS